MTAALKLRPLTADAFAPYGDVIDVAGDVDKYINQGKCARYHDRAALDFQNGRAGISVFQSEAFSLPIKLEMVERHPEGSQAFLPLSDKPFVVVVAPDQDGTPGQPIAFKTGPGQGVNYHRNTWHGVLTPLHAPGLFAVVDRIGAGPNLEEHWFEEAFAITE
ncbi:ureidoglycolate lyase [Ruegeria sp. Ofav3-42]|uniref:ureidoglycolate lyase n=1 Tax=Ruegeria sp. Ofav3-42 TaxID=2917759 RepID=UPI001EF72800|nr:ureidoglycolate lyase [Ruegeria sp. Ofav3-42]MCG7522649.1 ureidoglycolate lyase [Ruegeria sp. Ofav3-42]